MFEIVATEESRGPSDDTEVRGGKMQFVGPSLFQVRPKIREMIPAVTYVDGTGRLQTVHKKNNLLVPNT